MKCQVSSVKYQVKNTKNKYAINYHTKIFFCIVLFTVYCLLSTVYLYSAETKTESPIFIKSDKVEYSDKTKEGEFTGNVVAIQDSLTLRAKKLKVKFDKGGKKINEITSLGDVEILRDDLLANSDQAVFYNAEQKIILTGKPRIISKDSKFSGEKITVYLKDNRIVMEKNVKGRIITK